MSLEVLFPNLNITIYDINPHQIKHFKKKQSAAIKNDLKDLNIGMKNDLALNQLGKFDKKSWLYLLNLAKLIPIVIPDNFTFNFVY